MFIDHDVGYFSMRGSYKWLHFFMILEWDVLFCRVVFVLEISIGLSIVIFVGVENIAYPCVLGRE